MGRLDNKIALITGAAQGMGASHAKKFLEEGAAHVYLTDVLDEKGAQTAAQFGDRASYIHLDVANEDDWKALVAQIAQEKGHLDVLVNNAGITRWGPLGVMTLEELQFSINVNQISVFLGMTHCLELLKGSEAASIINISSINGLKGGPGGYAYVGSKFAVTGMTKSAALELGHHGIRVNSVHPGVIDTPMIQQAGTAMAVAQFAQSIPLGRIAEAVEVSNVVAFLASDEASYVTGSAYLVDGGVLQL
ncbi:MAG: glucose 1-dehydrogenase [Actinomycetaceae bacterium]|nr:glucose 1-dehydrogenase [Actinomycetaceae bacterium]